MPLSDEEQQILKEIEAQLNETDPGLVEQVSRTTLYRHSARMIRWSAFGVLVGLLILVATFNHTLIGGGIGFLIMLGCLLVIERNVRKIGRAGFDSLTSGMRPGGNVKGVFGNFGKRWRDRWQRDDGP